MPTAFVVEGSGGPALATVRSLGRGGWRVLVPRGSRLERSRFAARSVPLPDPETASAEFAAAVAATLGTEPVDVIAPMADGVAELVWSLGDALGATRILGADAASFALCTDKARTLEAADRHGFPTPAWCAPETEAEAREALERIGLPCVVKARRSYTVEGGRFRSRRHMIVESEADLPAALEHGRERDGRLPVVQAFVPGRSLAVTAVVQERRIVAAAARETLSFFPVTGGTSVWKRTVPPTDVGVQESLAFLQALGYEGLGEVEYQVDAEGVPRLMEVGARLHGWVPLVCAAGVDLPLLGARALIGEQLPESAPYRVGVQMRWPAGELRRLRQAVGPRRDLPPNVSRWDVARLAWPPWAPGLRYDSVDLRDPAPWLPFGGLIAALRPAARSRRACGSAVPQGEGTV